MKNRNTDKATGRTICSDCWTFLRTRDTYAGTSCTKLYGIPDERSPWTLPHTVTLAFSYTYMAAKGPAHARKGNEAWFQLSGITLLASCHYLSGYRDWRGEESAGSIIGNERASRVIFVRPAMISPFGTINQKEKGKYIFMWYVIFFKIILRM